jgi:hypothetical protein
LPKTLSESVVVVVASELSYALQTGIYFLEFGLQMVLMSSSLKGGGMDATVFLGVSVLRVFGFRDLSKHRQKRNKRMTGVDEDFLGVSC